MTIFRLSLWVCYFIKAEASLRVGSKEVVFQGGFSQPHSESESQVSKMVAKEQKAGKPSRRQASKTSKKAEDSFEDRIKEKMRLSIESRFAQL